MCTTAWCALCPIVSTCNECLAGYFLTADNKCVSTCPLGTAAVIVANGADLCTACKVGCADCTNATNTCVTCLQGLTNSYDGSCHQNTTNSSCPSGQYIAQVSPLQCAACHSSCLTCYGGAASQCLSCPVPGFAYQNGYCITVCSSTQFYSTTNSRCEPCNAQCLTCSVTAATCTSCPTGTYLTASNTCEVSCPSNTYRSSLSCKPCPNFCATCTSEAYCTSCTGAATIMYNSICYNACPTGTYQIANASSSLGSCTNCPVQCLACTSGSACQACAVGYFLDSAQCNQVCPERYFANSQSNTCDPC